MLIQKTNVGFIVDGSINRIRYTLIVYKENNRKNEKILRTTLANVEKEVKELLG